MFGRYSHKCNIFFHSPQVSKWGVSQPWAWQLRPLRQVSQSVSTLSAHVHGSSGIFRCPSRNARMARAPILAPRTRLVVVYISRSSNRNFGPIFTNLFAIAWIWISSLYKLTPPPPPAISSVGENPQRFGFIASSCNRENDPLSHSFLYRYFYENYIQYCRLPRGVYCVSNKYNPKDYQLLQYNRQLMQFYNLRQLEYQLWYEMSITQLIQTLPRIIILHEQSWQ